MPGIVNTLSRIEFTRLRDLSLCIYVGRGRWEQYCVDLEFL